ncbi:MAG: hypothetical protein ABIH21_01625 [Patescibacteria group bacterium]
MKYIKYKGKFIIYFFVAPVICTAIIPIVLMDIWVEIYHRICFPICNIPYVKRRDYIKIDRHKLSYLNWLQKLGCVYCGYANGCYNYWVRIAAETEVFWCGIMHQKRKGFIPPAHHKDFTEFGDEKAYRQKYK